MLYYNEDISKEFPKLYNYFSNGILDETKNISHCLLFWGPDIKAQCELALEISRLLNCSEKGESSCTCLNCRWIKEQTHPAVKIYTRLDYKESEQSYEDEEAPSRGKTNISVEQAKSIITELSITSDYHRVYIFCDRDEDGNLLPLNRKNFPEATSNSLLKTFEEPPKNTTFIFLTNDKNDVISTVVSRAQSFFVPLNKEYKYDCDLVENIVKNYWQKDRQGVLDFADTLINVIQENEAKEILNQFQNYIIKLMKTVETSDKQFYYKLLFDLTAIEDAKRQLALKPSMNIVAVIENLCFKIIL